jgi:phosphatidylserine decarboxylase
MAELRQGEPGGCPFEPLDPRDVKFLRNQGGYHWAKEHDKFAWRDRLPFARDGLAELFILSGCFFLTAALVAIWDWRVASVPAALGLFPFWFFRDPRRVPPTEPGLVVSPADGRVVGVEESDHDDFLGGPAVKISIFLSVFNVHINRVPRAVQVVGLSYRPGRFLNAMKPASARENEQLTVRLEETQPPHRRLIVRQIAGAVARRIVCWVRPGDELNRGAQFGLIKLGSRTELVMPREAGLSVEVRRGQKVKAGTSVLARYE